MTRDPAEAPAATPSRPKRTDSTSGVSETHNSTISTPRASAAGVTPRRLLRAPSELRPGPLGRPGSTRTSGISGPAKVGGHRHGPSCPRPITPTRGRVCSVMDGSVGPTALPDAAPRRESSGRDDAASRPSTRGDRGVRAEEGYPARAVRQGGRGHAHHHADLLRLPDRLSAGAGRHRHDPGRRQPGHDDARATTARCRSRWTI